MAIISYYDIDEILAEEELLPVTNNFDFTCLAHLDPDYVHSTHQHYQNNQNKKTGQGWRATQRNRKKQNPNKQKWNRTHQMGNTRRAFNNKRTPTHIWG